MSNIPIIPDDYLEEEAGNASRFRAPFDKNQDVTINDMIASLIAMGNKFGFESEIFMAVSDKESKDIDLIAYSFENEDPLILIIPRDRDE